jgi:hypothetical protein
MPAWRWEAAGKLLEEGKRPRRWEDAPVKEALKFRRARQGAKTASQVESVRRRWPDLWAAVELYEHGGATRDEVDSWLIYGGPALAAEKTGITVTVLEVYTTQFFGGPSRLKAPDWLRNIVLDFQELRRERPAEGELWKCLGYMRCPIEVLEIVIADHLGRPEPKVPFRNIVAERARFEARFFAADMSPTTTARFIHERRRRFGPTLVRDPMYKCHVQFINLLARTAHSRTKQPSNGKMQGTPRQTKGIKEGTQAYLKSLSKLISSKGPRAFWQLLF